MKKLLAFVKNPHGGWLIVIWILGIAGCAASITLVSLSISEVWAYAVYALSALFFGYAVYALVRFLPRAKSVAVPYVKKCVRKYPVLGTLFGDYKNRTLLFSTLSFVMNVGYVALNIVMAVMVSFAWYGALAAYYFVLGALRYNVLGGVRRAKKRAQDERALVQKKLKIYKNCGIALLISEGLLAFGITNFFMTSGIAPEEIALHSFRAYTLITMIASAAYTFYKVCFAVYNFIKVKKMADPEIWALRNINLAAALVSLLALQVAMTSFFEPTLSTAMQVFHSLTVVAVGVMVTGMGISMIVNGNKKIAKLRAQTGSEKEEKTCFEEKNLPER